MIADANPSPENRSEMSQVTLLALVGLQAAVFTALGLAIWWFTARSISGFISFTSSEWLNGTALGLAMSALAALGFYGLPKVTDHLVRLQGKTYAFLKEPLPIWAIVWISICAGVSEEALFRAGLQTLLTDYVGPVAAIVIASAIFALVHMAKPIVASIIFLIGVLFGVIYWQTGSLLTVMLAHAVYDIFALWYLQKRLHQLDFFKDTGTRREQADAVH